ncbi:MAG: HAD family hydrolase [Elusimicrobiota bacterium]
MTINTLLFDLGNVLLPFDVTRLANRLARFCRLSTNEIIDFLWNDYIANHFETGKMEPHAYFAHITEVCRFENLSYAEFKPIFNEIFDHDQEMVEILHKLKPSYNLGLISNTNAIHVEHILKEYPFLGLFDRHWFSNEAGIRKPDPAIYHMALSHFSISPHQAVFVDDLNENIESARKIGIKGILFQGAPLLKKELNTLGVQI